MLKKTKQNFKRHALYFNKEKKRLRKGILFFPGVERREGFFSRLLFLPCYPRLGRSCFPGNREAMGEDWS